MFTSIPPPYKYGGLIEVDTMKTRNVASIMLLVVILAFLLPFYTLSFFGVYVGRFSVFGINIEHEWVGLGMIIAGYASALLVHKKINYKHLIVPIVGTFLFLSDFMSGSIFTNTYASMISILLGVVIGILINLSWM